MIEVIDTSKSSLDRLYSKLLKRSQMELGDIYSKVDEIVKSVKKDKDTALLELTERFDKVQMSKDELRVSPSEIEDAYKKVSKELLEVIRKAKTNIEKFHLKQKENSWFSTEEDGVLLGQLYRPLQIIGVYVPGGTASYPSSVLMNIVPAKVAGVERIVMVTPPKQGGIDPVVLVAANEAGVDEIYKIGGAQAVAALAFGTETVPKVDKIVGPGNAYVTMAKKLVYGYCDIDAIAGPSEITIIADSSANPAFVAADLLSQAEHDCLASSVLVTDSEKLAYEVQIEIEKQMESLLRKEIMRRSIDDYGTVVIVQNLEQAVEVVNKIAPEHLELCVDEAFNLLGGIKNAGAIFLGHYASEPLGDYFAGPNHVLPTSGTARFFSPLNVGDFIKKSSVISYSKKALQKVKEDVILFAEAEGLTAHANAIRVRFDK